MVKIEVLKEEILEQFSGEIKDELKSLCSTNNPSVLRKTSKEDLINFSWESVHKELQEKTPTLERFARACVENPSQSRNVHKKDEALIPGMCDAVCQLISIFSEGMNLTRTVKSVILKKCGLTKVGFKRLASVNVCMGYNATNSLFERFGEDFDKELLYWKEQVEKDVKKEREISDRIDQLEKEQAPVQVIANESERLRVHRESMHPGYSFTGDNVDMIIKPRQMTQANQNKDHHMFQYIAYENRVSPNHLSDEVPIGDINKVPFTTFLPSTAEQELLSEQLAIAVCHIWAAHIPSLSWFSNCVPSTIPHKHMNEMKKNTNKVSKNISIL